MLAQLCRNSDKQGCRLTVGRSEYIGRIIMPCDITALSSFLWQRQVSTGQIKKTELNQILTDTKKIPKMADYLQVKDDSCQETLFLFTLFTFCHPTGLFSPIIL